jgi:acyl carrier protein
MEESELRAGVLGALRRVAPELEERELDARAPLREEVDLDSIVFLRFLAELDRRLGIDIPDADAARLTTFEECVRYLAGRLGPAGT